MIQITSENIPKCQKCEKQNAFTLYCGIWLCPDCFNRVIEKETKLKQQHILEL